MNEINKQKRLRDASQMAAEAEKIKVLAVNGGKQDSESIKRCWG